MFRGSREVRFGLVRESDLTQGRSDTIRTSMPLSESISVLIATVERLSTQLVRHESG